MLAAGGQLSATAIYGRFKVSHPAISQHLKVLREAKLVSMEKRAQRHIYRLNPESVYKVEEWAKRTTRLWNGRFDRLDEVLEMEKRKAIKKR
jgi:DNA-binding transcriptional ArsR family regulator